MFFFEGAEKKAEVIVNQANLGSLNSLPISFWQELVSHCDAKILSSVANEYCTAYLLSESSLFVWSDRFWLVTCGTCTLVKAITFFADVYGADAIAHLSYQRKNEYFAHAQPSCFGDDVALLTQYVQGKSYCFGDMDSHHNYLFHQDSGYSFTKHNRSYEFVAYQIGEQASKLLTCPSLTSKRLRQFFQLDKLLPDFLIDDHCFQPYGYSLNALKGHDYFTLHVTPQAHSSYISIATNINLFSLLSGLLERLQPKSIDLLTRNESEFLAQVDQYLPAHFVSQTQVAQQFDANNQVHFGHYIVPATALTEATLINDPQQEHIL